MKGIYKSKIMIPIRLKIKKNKHNFSIIFHLIRIGLISNMRMMNKINK